jgi:hypothetical protein
MHLKNTSHSFIGILVALRTVEPALTKPEYTLKKQSLPTNGSVAILNARAEKGSLSDEGLSHSSPVSGLIP